MGNFIVDIYDDIYKLGSGYKKAFCAVGRFFAKCFKAVWHFICRICIAVFGFFRNTVKKYFNAVIYEFRKFRAEVKRAVPVLKTDLKEKPVRAFGRFLKYVFHAFVVHKRFNRAVISTVIPVVAVVFLFSFSVALKSMTFGLEVFVNGESVGIVRDENAYKEAEKQAKHRFVSMGSEMNASLPEYSVTLTMVNCLDDTETVCNNIIAAVSERTINACGIYVNGEFAGAVGSEDTFIRVRDRVFKEFAESFGFVADDCRIEFADEVTTVSGVYPDNDKIMTADGLYKFLSGNKVDGIEHTVAKDEDVTDILEKYSISEQELLENNIDLDVDRIPEGSVLLIKKAEKNMSIKVTRTYMQIENIPFETITQYDNNLYVGKTMTVVAGVNGQDIVSYTDTYIDGIRTDSSREILRYNANKPVNQLIKIGTMGIPVDNNGVAVSPRLTRDQGGTFVWPAPDNCFWLSQGYKPYNSHYGIDIVSSDDGSCRGRRIVAVADGVVVMATYHWSWGYYIRVDHGNGVVTGYAHALEGSFRVNVGDFVRAGQHLSSIGTTGRSTGYHLHFEVWLDGVRVNPLPYVYSQYTGVAIKYY